ncbi:MAG TPA: LamG domain-containing protein, partial [Streptosporangiaceae bacterium]
GVDGQVDTAMEVNGTTGYADTDEPVVDTTKSYSVSAWVNPRSAPDHAVILSQTGARRSEFELFSAGGHWAFGKLPADDASAAEVHIVSPQEFQLGEWAHLVGVYDATAGLIRLYVNGRVKGEAPFTATPWQAQGPLRIGAGSRCGRPATFFEGAIDEVRVFDRIVVPDEAAELARQAPTVEARWKLNEATASSPLTSADDTGHGHTLGLAGDARIDPAGGLLGDPPGGLVLDGEGDYAATSGPVVSTKRSFTVLGWVTTAGRPAADATVFSQAGKVNSGFILRYSPSAFNGSGGYELEMPESDAVGAPRHIAVHPSFQSAFEWDAVAVVYDAAQDEMRLYVNGQPDVNGSIQTGVVGFDATGGLQIGRSKSDGVWGEYWPGAIDDVWVFSGALSQTEVQELAGLVELPTGNPA